MRISIFSLSESSDPFHVDDPFKTDPFHYKSVSFADPFPGDPFEVRKDVAFETLKRSRQLSCTLQQSPAFGFWLSYTLIDTRPLSHSLNSFQLFSIVVLVWPGHKKGPRDLLVSGECNLVPRVFAVYKGKNLGTRLRRVRIELLTVSKLLPKLTHHVKTAGPTGVAISCRNIIVAA